jgi:7-keto-8-aminopelargonate synthetase-like enzyme
MAGDAAIIEELRYTSRCYMFRTSPKPFVMAMIKEALQQWLRTAIDFDGRMLTDKSKLG